MIVHTILYVADQKKSTDLYSGLLNLEPDLNVPGMTEFKLSEGHVLGLMPEKGIKRLLGEVLPDPSAGSGIPRVELYLRVADARLLMKRALELNFKVISDVLPRDWGNEAGYVMDADGHVIAFAHPSV